MQRESPSAAVAPDVRVRHRPMLQMHGGVPAFSSLVGAQQRGQAAAGASGAHHRGRGHSAPGAGAPRMPPTAAQHRAGQRCRRSRPTRWPASSTLIVGDSDVDVQAAVDAKRRARHVGRGAVPGPARPGGAPASARCGSDDLCDFTDGHRGAGPAAAGAARAEPGLRHRGRAPGQRPPRAVCAAPDEQHSFGLSHGGRVLPPRRLGRVRRRRRRDRRPGRAGAQGMVRRGRLLDRLASAGCDWLRRCIAAVRAASRNPGVVGHGRRPDLRAAPRLGGRGRCRRHGTRCARGTARRGTAADGDARPR